jgi:hypothetical protein
MLAQALLGVEKTDHNRCTSLYRLYGLHPADVGATAGLLASSRSLRRRQEPWCPFQQRVRWRMDKVDVAFPWPGDRAVAVSANFGSWLLLGVVASFDVNEVF